METTDKLNNIYLCEPKVGDRPLWDLFLEIYAYSTLVTAHMMKLFAILTKKPHTLEEVCSTLDIIKTLPVKHCLQMRLI